MKTSVIVLKKEHQELDGAIFSKSLAVISGDALTIDNISVLSAEDFITFSKRIEEAETHLDNLIILEEEAVSTDFMNWLYDRNADITGGDIYVRGFNETQLQKYREKWNRLKITLKRVIPTEVIYGITGEGGLDE
jgi:hypothetical protein